MFPKQFSKLFWIHLSLSWVQKTFPGNSACFAYLKNIVAPSLDYPVAPRFQLGKIFISFRSFVEIFHYFVSLSYLVWFILLKGYLHPRFADYQLVPLMLLPYVPNESVLVSHIESRSKRNLKSFWKFPRYSVWIAFPKKGTSKMPERSNQNNGGKSTLMKCVGEVCFWGEVEERWRTVHGDACMHTLLFQKVIVSFIFSFELDTKLWICGIGTLKLIVSFKVLALKSTPSHLRVLHSHPILLLGKIYC